jgi:hypothetical protein
MLKTKRPLIYLSGLLPFVLNQNSYIAVQTAEVGLAGMKLQTTARPFTEVSGCPMFALAYVGRKRRAKPFDCFYSFSESI